MAAERLRVNTSNLRVVAVHDWDIIGRWPPAAEVHSLPAGIAFNPLAPQADVFEPTLEAIAEAISASMV